MDAFKRANTQVLGVSIDSVHCHANWARDLGGVSFPLLADFQPKGAVAKSLGHYLDGPGITDRATVIIDKEGVVRYSESVTPAGSRDMAELLAECEKINGSGSAAPASTKLSSGTTLFVKSACGVSRRARVAIDNLHASKDVAIRNVSDDAAAKAELLKSGGKDQAPCLVLEGKYMYESGDLIAKLADTLAPLL